MSEAESFSFNALLDSLGGEIPTPFRLLLSFGTLRIDLHSNSTKVVTELSDYFGSFVLDPTQAQPPAQMMIRAIESPPIKLPMSYTVKAPDSGKSKIKEEFVDIENGRLVRKRLTGMLFLFNLSEHLAIGPCEENLNQVVNFVNSRCIQYFLEESWLLAHASAVSLESNRIRRGLAIAGFSGRGKSTLSLQMLEEGATFHSNDRLMIRRRSGGHEMVGVAKLPRINPGTILSSDVLRPMLSPEALARYQSLPPDQLWELEEKYDARIDKLYGQERFRLEGPLNAVVILTWIREGGAFQATLATAERRRELLTAFAKEPGLFYLPGEESRHTARVNIERYEKELSGCPLYEFSGGVDFVKARAFCIRILQGAM
jgi:HprK-related kinase B